MDPFTGSGTTAKVAHQMNRRFVGYELRPDEPITAFSTWAGDMRVPPTNRSLIKHKIDCALNIKDPVQARNFKLLDFFEGNK